MGVICTKSKERELDRQHSVSVSEPMGYGDQFRKNAPTQERLSMEDRAGTSRGRKGRTQMSLSRMVGRVLVGNILCVHGCALLCPPDIGTIQVPQLLSL